MGNAGFGVRVRVHVGVVPNCPSVLVFELLTPYPNSNPNAQHDI